MPGPSFSVGLKSPIHDKYINPLEAIGQKVPFNDCEFTEAAVAQYEPRESDQIGE